MQTLAAQVRERHQPIAAKRALKTKIPLLHVHRAHLARQRYPERVSGESDRSPGKRVLACTRCSAAGGYRVIQPGIAEGAAAVLQVDLVYHGRVRGQPL